MKVIVNADDRKKVIVWIHGGLAVSEIHQRLEVECGLRLSRLEVRLLVADLENAAEESSTPIARAPVTEAAKTQILVAEKPTRIWKTESMVDFIEKRLRASEFERNVAGRIPGTIRWLLFIPTGLIAGILTSLVTLLGFTIVPDDFEEVRSFGGMAAGLLAAISTVYVGIAVAPRNARIVVTIMGWASIMLAVSVCAWALRFHDSENRVCVFILAASYCCCAVVNALVLRKGVAC